MQHPKLTDLEKQLLQGCLNSDFCSFEDGPWFFDAVDQARLGSKVARGVVSSLIKKGLVEIHDNIGWGKYDDMVIIPRGDCLAVCKALGMKDDWE